MSVPAEAADEVRRRLVLEPLLYVHAGDRTRDHQLLKLGGALEAEMAL
jgi:hypothetical protein